MKVAFLEGAKTKGILTEEQAKDLFGWIEKSQRYSFNKSHAVSYACNAYLSAFAKAHFARAFFTSYLRYSKEKQRPYDEIHELIQNARLMAVNINGPDIRHLYKHFKLIDKRIYFGFYDIKGIGESVWNKIIKQLETTTKTLNKPIDKWTWLEFLVHCSQGINSTAVVALINSGSLSFMGVSRTRMTYEYNLYDKLTEKEKRWTEKYVLLHGDIQLQDVLTALTASATGKNGACANEKRRNAIYSLIKTLTSPSYNLNDAPEWMASVEESLLGIPLTCTSIDACDTSAANCTCLEYAQGCSPKVILVAAKIDSVNEIKTKTGKNPGRKMAFLKVSDISGSIDNVVIFPDVWEEARKIVFLGNNILIHGERSKNQDSFVVKQVWQI
jgi:DNA polymerase-3 subunit alpha